MQFNSYYLRQKLEALKVRLREHWLRYFLILLGLMLVVSAVLMVITPEGPERTPVEIEGIDSGITKPPQGVNVRIDVSENELDFPKLLPIYSGVPAYKSAENYASSVANSLNLNRGNNAYQANTWSNDREGQTLVFYEHDDKMMFIQSQPEEIDGVSRPPINPQNPAVAANAFFSKLTDYPKLQPRLSDAVYLSGEETLPTSEGAEAAIVPFDFVIDGYSTHYAASRSTQATITFGPGETIIKVEFYPPPPSPQKVADKSLIPLSKVKEKIENGMVEVIEAGNATGRFDITSLTSLTVDNMSLEYRYSPQTQVYYPYYRMGATGKASGDSTANVYLTLITPAVETLP